MADVVSEAPGRARSTDRPDLDLVFLFVVASATILVTYALIGLLFAMGGAYDTVAVSIVTVVTLAIGSLVFARRCHASGGRFRFVTDPWSAAAIGVVALVAIWSADRTGRHVVTIRDPGSYATTARWLARKGTLSLDASTPLLEGLRGVSYDGPAVYDMGDGRLEFQFSHGPSVLMAGAFDLVGARGIFFLPVVAGSIGLMALYFAIRALGVSPIVSLGAVTALGISLPYQYVVRGTYSEPFVLAAVWTGLAMVLINRRSRIASFQAALAGLMLGSTMLFRVDGLLYVAATCFVGIAVLAVGTRQGVVAWCVGAAAVPTVVGLVDQQVFTGLYADKLAGSINPLLVLALVAAAAVSIAAVTIRRTGWRFAGATRTFSISISAAIVAVVVFLWLVRPRFMQGRVNRLESSPSGQHIRAIQLEEESRLEPFRSYAELSVSQLAWYFGAVVLAFACVGFGIMTYRSLRGGTTNWVILVVFAAIATPLYVWRPSITPDQLWSTRRFVPFVFPVFLVAAAVVMEWLLDEIRQRWNASRRPIGFVLAGLFVLPAGSATWPIRDMSEQRADFGGLVETCAVLGEDAQVLAIDNGLFLMMLRAWCGADAANVRLADADAAVSAFVAGARSTCTDAYLVAGAPSALDPYADAAQERWEIVRTSDRVAEFTLDRRPSGYVVREYRIAIARVADDDSC